METNENQSQNEVFDRSEETPNTLGSVRPSPGDPIAQDIPNKKGKGHLVIIGLVCLLIVLVGVYIYYSRILTSPKNVFRMAIENIYEVIKNAYDPTDKINLTSAILDEKSISLDLDGTLSVRADGQSSSYSMRALIETDKDYENVKMDLGLNQGKDEVLDLSFYEKEDELYTASTRLFSKIVDLGVLSDADDKVKDLLEDDTYTLITITKDYLIANMKDEDFSKSRGKLDINGSSHTVDKYTYKMTAEVAEELLIGYAECIEEKVQDGTLALKDETREAIAELSDADYSDFETIYVSIYAKNAKDIYGFDVEQNDSTIASFAYDGDKLEAWMNIQNKNILSDYSTNDTEIEDMTIKFLGEGPQDKLTVDVYVSDHAYDDTRVGSFTIEELIVDDDREKFTISYEIDGGATMIEGSFSFDVTCKIKDNDISADYEINFTVGANDFEMVLDLTMSAKTIEEVSLPSFEDAIKIEEMTENDWTSILENLEKALTGTDFEPILDLFFVNHSFDYDYDDEDL